MTSPGSLLIGLASAAFPDMTIVHPCELPFATLRQVSEASAVPLDDITFDYVGVNHLGWLYNVRADGHDVLARLTTTRDDGEFPSATLLHSLRAFPLKYLRLHYERQQVVDEQRRLATSRAEELSKLASWAFTAFQSGSASTIRAVLRKRRADWYPDSVAPLVRAWMGDVVDTPLFLTVADRSRPIAERRYRAVGGELVEVAPHTSPESGVGALLEQLMRYEQAAASAVIDGSEIALAQALCAHPWVSSDGSARRMARKLAAYARAFADETGAHVS
jgi:6-phospho-beta-glucosidase